MRFLVDECTGPQVARWLREADHLVFSVYEQARGLDDDALIRKAFDEDWILVTNDKDFGEKVYREQLPHRGVIFLCLDDEPSLPVVPETGLTGGGPTDSKWSGSRSFLEFEEDHLKASAKVIGVATAQGCSR